MSDSCKPLIDIYCNNDVLGLIFEYVGGFDMLVTIPFVCKRWKKVASYSPLTFTPLKGWAFALPENALHNINTNVSVLASTKNREYIPYHDIKMKEDSLSKYINHVYFKSVVDEKNTFLLGTLDFEIGSSAEKFYFVLEHANIQHNITIHSNLFELLAYGTSDNFKMQMKSRYFDRLKKKRIKDYQHQRRRKKYR